MNKLYACLGSGNCFKPWLVMNQLGQSFELHMVDVLKGEQKSDWYLDINPLGVVPFMTTERGHVIGESNAMLWYLAEDSELMPPTKSERAEALQWMFYEQSKLEPMISPARFFTTILPHEKEKRAEDIATWQQMAKPGLERLNAHLEQRVFMLKYGYSIADVALFGYVHVTEEAGISLSDYPAISRWIAQVEQTRGFTPLGELGQPKNRVA
ncbi:MAG: glutathione S-transferase family protein [Pseudomonadota bacterium]